jgi:glucose-6-phosphate dehydrogenase assembly protein OpcA
MNFSVETIEKDLRQIWQQLAAADGPTPQAITKTCVANLVVYTPCTPSTDEINRITQEVILHHPSRIIFLSTSGNSQQESIDAWGSVHCQLLAGSHRQICCEQIVITATAAIIGQLPDLIARLCIKGLPVTLYWCDNLSASRPLFDQLRLIADHLIIDSGIATQTMDLDIVHSLYTTRNMIFSDINWGRLTGWREALAAIYDISSYRSYLARINRLHITGGLAPLPTPSGYMPGLLIGGWLASRLDWQPTPFSTASDAAATWQFTNYNLPIIFKATPINTLDNIQSIELSANSSPEATFTVSLLPDTAHLRTTVTLNGQQLTPKVTKLAIDNEARLLSQALGQTVPDQTYGETLAFLHKWETNRR